MAVDHTNKGHPAIIEEQLFCSLTSKPITREEAYWAPPLITFNDLVRAVGRGLQAPGTLGQVFFGEQQDVPYAQDAREELGRRRSAEQLKLLVALLVIITLIASLIFLLVMR